MEVDVGDLFDAFNDNENFPEAKKMRLKSSSEGEEPPRAVSLEEERASDTSSSVVKEAFADSKRSLSERDVKPAKVYPFKLDPFQQEAVGYIEKNESVLVAAHTSAGKTAVAEYAIAKCFRDGQKVVYTSPIKALSNQKFRDMQEEFGDVGLMTGDMTINPGATCLIMTTEILRSMLYRGSELMREVAWVVYDEVHYMRDKERGVVWEESIVLLPHKVRFVFLSATIPNSKEFVGWVSKIHHQPCHVVYTNYRPVPLQHFVFPLGAEGLYLVVDEKGNFRDDNFEKAMGYLHVDEMEEQSLKAKKKGNRGLAADLFKIVQLVMEKELDPCIVFSFSKKDCETYARQTSKLDFNGADEKALVRTVFNSALEALSEEDRHLPQVETLLPLLERGIGIHHGGLLPILKEVIEILFQEGLIKCLFATETFSIGINMPARTVVFTNTRKFDGKDFRWVTSGEYIQMSGRAGRRGKDDRGIVIQMVDEKMEPDVAKGMLYGASDPLFSSYHVTYNMVVNMLRVEDANPENLLRYSFFQYQQEQQAPELERQADECTSKAATFQVEDEAEVVEYHGRRQLRDDTREKLWAEIFRPDRCSAFLQTGRLVQVRDEGWGPITAVRREKKALNKAVRDRAAGAQASASKDDGFSLEVLVLGKDNAGNKVVKSVPSVGLGQLCGISAVRLNLPSDVNKDSSRRNIFKAMSEVMRRFKEVPPPLEPVKDMGIDDDMVKELSDQATKFQQDVVGARLHDVPDRDQRLDVFSQRLALLEKARQLRQEARTTQAVTMRDELRKMKRVLRKLNYVSPEGVLTTKGQFACQLNTADELMVTDMIFEGLFSDTSPEHAVALLSCFVHQEPVKDDAPSPRADLRGSFERLKNIAKKIGEAKAEMNLDCDVDEYVNSFNPGLMEVAHAWASGMSFVEVCKLSDFFEGNVIRSLRRLEELLRQCATGAGAIGNVELKLKFEDGAKKIRRGIVFAASLYI